MSVITFWSSGKEQTGKTLAMTAIATYMAIEHNYRILVISTTNKNDALRSCFWEEKKNKKNLGIFGPNTSVDMETGIEGLTRVVRSNKVSPDIITNYTKIVFKDRLEVLLGSVKNQEVQEIYPDIITLANQYYDLVFVDLDENIDSTISKNILENSNIIIANLSQRLRSINEFNELRQQDSLFNTKKVLILIGRYDKFSKYTSKNISRYLGEKNQVLTIPYNTLFFEACEEAGVPDLFLRFRRLDSDDRNTFFIQEIKRAADNIIYRLQDLQMKM